MKEHWDEMNHEVVVRPMARKGWDVQHQENTSRLENIVGKFKTKVVLSKHILMIDGPQT